MFELLENHTGQLHIETTKEGAYRLRGVAAGRVLHVPHSPYVTTYPIELIRVIFDAYGAVHTCDEISREADETEAPLDVRYIVAAYLPEIILNKELEILDYGCGAGSSTITLSRIFPSAKIIGRDFMEKLLLVANLRAKHRCVQNVRFEQVAQSGKSPEGDKEEFDLIFLNASYEHFLPDERSEIMSHLWSILRPGGVLLVSQTPHRWFPIEAHTSGLPLVNYLSDSVAHWAVRRFSRRDVTERTWEQLLRGGIRGASVREIMGILRLLDNRALRLRPTRISRSWAGIWYAAKLARLTKVETSFLRGAIKGAEIVVRLTCLPFSPYLNIAVSKCRVEIPGQ